MATATTAFPNAHMLPAEKSSYIQPSHTPGVKTSSPPFNFETTLTFEAVEYWAKVDPHRTALISTDKQWKVEHGKLTEKHTVASNDEWTTVSYGDFWKKVNRMRAALHLAGIPVPKPGQKPFKLLLLYAPTGRADVLALLLALQATGCILLFGTPEAFGGIRPFMETMLKLEPDAVIANKMVYGVFRAICMTLSGIKKKPTWIKHSVFTKGLAKLEEKEIEQYANMKSGVTLDSVTAIMFSSGTTGPPTPIEISQRMLSFQAAGYAQLLQKHLGQGIIKEHSSITGTIGDDCVLTSKRDGPWISTHIFVNFVMLDLVLGGTAVMQPMGISCPDHTVDAPALLNIWDHFQTQVTSAPPALWKRLLKLKQQRDKHAWWIVCNWPLLEEPKHPPPLPMIWQWNSFQNSNHLHLLVMVVDSTGYMEPHRSFPLPWPMIGIFERMKQPTTCVPEDMEFVWEPKTMVWRLRLIQKCGNARVDDPNWLPIRTTTTSPSSWENCVPWEKQYRPLWKLRVALKNQFPRVSFDRVTSVMLIPRQSKSTFWGAWLKLSIVGNTSSWSHP